MKTRPSQDTERTHLSVRLEPIRPIRPMLPPILDTDTVHHGLRNRQRRETMHALLQRTTAALDRIVDIRVSLEPFVDFNQFEREKERHLYQSATIDASRQRSHAEDGSDNAPIRVDTSTEQSMENRILLHSSSSFEAQSQSSVDSGDNDTICTGISNEDEDSDRNDAIEATTNLADDQNLEFQDLCSSRIQLLTLELYGDFPKEFYHVIGRFIKSVLTVTTHRVRFTFFKETFLGADFVWNLVMSGFALDQKIAVQYGSVLIKLKIIEHVSHTEDQLHNSREHCYRFNKAVSTLCNEAVHISNQTVSSGGLIEYETAVEQASNEMLSLLTPNCVTVLSRVLQCALERKNKLLFYKGFTNCFLGSEAVDALKDWRIVNTGTEALLLGQTLLVQHFIQPLATEVVDFQDTYIFYRFCGHVAFASTY